MELANAFTAVFSEYVRELQEARYRSSLSDMEAKVADLQAQAGETESKIDEINAAKLDALTDRSRLETKLAAARSQYSYLQQSYQGMQLTSAGLGSTIKIAQPARAQGVAAGSPYTAAVTMLVDQQPVGGRSGLFAATDSKQLAATYAQLVKLDSVLEAAVAESGVRIATDELAGKISIANLPGTQLIQLSVADEDAAQAILLANSVAKAFVEEVQMLLLQPYAQRRSTLQAQLEDLSTQIDTAQAEIVRLATLQMQADAQLTKLENQRTEQHNDQRAAERELEQLRLAIVDTAGTVIVAEPAQVPVQPVRSAHLYTLLAALLGLLVGLAVVVVVERMDESLRTREDVSQMLGLSTLASIDHLSAKDCLSLGSGGRRAHATEAFMILATNILSKGKPYRTFLVTSSMPSEGKSLVTANLAVALARTGLRIIVVDADLRRPRLHCLFKTESGRGLAEALHTGEGAAYLQSTHIDGLQFLSAGKRPADPVATLSSPNLAKLVAELEREADVLLIDSPSVLGIADVRILTQFADGVLFVVHAGHTSRRDAQEAVELLHQAGAPIMGAVLNAVQGRHSAYDQYHRRPEPISVESGDSTGRMQVAHAFVAQTEQPETVAHS